MGALPRSPRSAQPPTETPARRNVRDQRGVALPSPVVVLTVVAVAMAAVAWFATGDPQPTEREVTPVAESSTPSESPSPEEPEETKEPKPEPPPVVRGDVFVEVYNNSGITGLASEVGTQAIDAGWKLVGTDNWYGTIPTNTVYYPERLEDAAEMLALDLGIDRTAPAVDPMRLDRLTVILTGPLA